MTIKNPVLIWVLKKLLRIKTLKAEFTYIKEVYDRDVTHLGFLNQVRSEFGEQSDLFKEEIDKEIEKASGST